MENEEKLNFDKVATILMKVCDKLPKITWEDKVFYDEFQEALKTVDILINAIDYKEYVTYKHVAKLERVLACLIDRLEYPNGNSDEDPDSLQEMACTRDMLLEAVDEDKEYEFVDEYFKLGSKAPFDDDYEDEF